MAGELSDEMLDEIVVQARTDEAGAKIVERYRGLVDRIGLYERFTPAQERTWRSLIEAARS